MDLTPGQKALVDHPSGPARVTGGFGSGTSYALAARAERLRREGRRPLLVRAPDLVEVAIGVLRRQGRSVALIADDARLALVASIGGSSQAPPPTVEAAAAIEGFEASFLGDEELRVHADAAGCLERAEELIDLTARYLAALSGLGVVDASGALVEASLALRHPDVLAQERARFDDLLVDDFQLATFATARLVGQLAGRDGDVVVAGNAEAAISSAPLASVSHLEHFVRRFGASTDISLTESFRRPAVHLVERDPEAAPIQLTKSGVEAAVGGEWTHIVVTGASDGAWPAPRPTNGWFDVEVFHGPDVPDDAERDRRWLDLERRRFSVATSRATDTLTVVTGSRPSPFVADLDRSGQVAVQPPSTARIWPVT